jgi:hypothetical protein
VYLLPDRILRSAFGALLLALGIGCAENVTGSLGCPQLCSDQSAVLRDTVLTGAISLDSSLVGFPLLGSSREFSLIAQGDTADVRLVIRIDTLDNTYRATGATTDSAIARVDSATLIFAVDTSGGARPKLPFTIDAFDVDTTANDTLPATLIPLFRESRRIGTASFDPALVKDTVRVPIDNAVVLAKAKAGARLRIGLRVRSTASVRLRVSAPLMLPRVRYRVSTDTLVTPETAFVRSFTPTNDASIAAALGVYPVVARGQQAAPPPGRIAVGGISGARTFVRFNVPGILIDSVEVIRASLVFEQLPSRTAASGTDTITVFVNPIVSGTPITDIFTASQFIGAAAGLIDSVRLVPRDSGSRSFELVNLFRAWRSVGDANGIRAIVLRAKQEGGSAAELNFGSSEAVAALRPRLRITYVPRRGFGLP